MTARDEIRAALPTLDEAEADQVLTFIRLLRNARAPIYGVPAGSGQGVTLEETRRLLAPPGTKRGARRRGATAGPAAGPPAG
jgi:hypothetical protein